MSLKLCAAAAMFTLALAAGAAASEPASSAPQAMQLASFWAQPYPYGYVGWRKRRCTRHPSPCVQTRPAAIRVLGALRGPAAAA
jgi:hypothetical protein